MRLTAFVTTSWMGFVGLIYLLFARFCMLPFAPPGAERTSFLELGSHILAFSISWQILDSYNFV